MKFYRLLFLLPLLSGCALGFFDSADNYLPAEEPAKYLQNEEGQFIDLKGEVVDEPVLNPYYTLFRSHFQ